MSHIKYIDSTYQFTDPVRFFKANDPYYFEVDNIPLKQLQENCLWLKDQLQRDTSDDEGGVSRKEIDELRPYSTGLDRTIRVKPGRFTARINDVSKEPLAYLTKILGDELGETNVWASELPMAVNPILLNTINKFKSTLAADALGMNGLAERAFTWPMLDESTPVNTTGVQMDPASSYFAYDKSTPPLNNPGALSYVSPTLITQALVWARNEAGDTTEISVMNFNPNAGIGAVQTPGAESHFIKKWRGVTRLAVVDVDTELTIDVPAFDSTDFNYTDSGGNSVGVPNVQSRIDLVFIYSKPIDSSSVNLMQSTGVTTITTPQLGIVKGAGIRMTEVEFNPVDTQRNSAKQGTTDNHAMLAAAGDQQNTSMGFTSTSGNDIAYDVRGSFPAPDDILNIAPLLSEKLESNAYELLGQSILPVAYVWVQGTGDTDSAGTTIISKTDVIDIRPLFRTAELAYNERAGIAAALPQISLANPVIGRANLDNESLKMINYVDNAIAGGGTGGGGFGVDANMEVIAAGYVFGGFWFGPEGALWDVAGGTQQDKQTVCDAYYGANAKTGSNNLAVPDRPDWDLSRWANLGTFTDPVGNSPNDYIDTFISQSTGSGGKATGGVAPDTSILGGSFRTNVDAAGVPQGANPRLGSFENADNMSTKSTAILNRVQFHYIKKKISFSGNRPSWLYDYDIDIKFINCLPQNSTGGITGDFHPALPGSYMGHWIEKHDEDFTIYIAFTARNTVSLDFPFAQGDFIPTKTNALLPSQQRTGGSFSGFVVPVQDLLEKNDGTPRGDNGYKGNPQIGMCTYPTIQWKMTGISTTDSSQYFNVNLGTNNIIQIKQ